MKRYISKEVLPAKQYKEIAVDVECGKPLIAVR